MKTTLGVRLLMRHFSLRYDLPTKWHAWTSNGHDLAIRLEKRHFPYFAQMGALAIESIHAFPRTAGETIINPVVNNMPAASVQDWFAPAKYKI